MIGIRMLRGEFLSLTRRKLKYINVSLRFCAETKSDLKGFYRRLFVFFKAGDGNLRKTPLYQVSATFVSAFAPQPSFEKPPQSIQERLRFKQLCPLPLSALYIFLRSLLPGSI